MYELPTEIEIKDVPYRIRNGGDYRTILDIFSVLGDETLTQQERVISSLIIFYEDLNSIEDLNKLPDIEEAVKKMYDFFNVGSPESSAKEHRKLVDWEQDEQLITAAINSNLGKEIRLESYIHWWTFMGYYMSIGESTFATVISIRNKSAKGEKLEKWERKFKTENSQYFMIDTRSIQQKEDDAWLKEIWDKE